MKTREYRTINVYPAVHRDVKQLALDEELKVCELIPKLIEFFKQHRDIDTQAKHT